MMKKDSMRMTTAQFAKLHEVNKRTLLCDADNDPDQGLVFINFLEKNQHSSLDVANNECYITNRTKVTRIHQKVINTPDRPVVLYIDDCIVGRRYDL